MAKTSALCWRECRNLGDALKGDPQCEQGAGSSNAAAAGAKYKYTEDSRFTWLGDALVASWGHEKLLVLLLF